MADDRKTDQKQDGTGNYITQKIVGKKNPVRRILLLFLKAAFCGAVFAAAAAAAGVLLFPLVKKRLGIDTETVREAVRVERDEAGTPESGTEAASETGTERPAETAQETEAETQQAEHPAESPEDAAKKLLGSYPVTAEDVLRFTGALKTAADAADRAVASVTRIDEERDWFDNALTSTGVNSGILVAKTESELLVLTTGASVNGADALTVTFPGDLSAEASVRQTDAPSGLALLSAAITPENEKKFRDLMPVELGNSYLLSRGDLIMALGAPCGTVHSSDYGFITGTAPGISIADGTESIFYADSCGTKDAGTWILSPRGELLGWVTDDPAEVKSGETAVAGISE